MKDRILIIEDDRALNAGLKFDLEAEGYQVCAAYSAGEGRAFAEKEQLRLVLLDVNLPGEDGFAFCRWLKQQNDSVPVVFLTARDLEEDAIAGFDLGADDYITKPFSMAVLRRKLAAVLKRTRKCISERIFNDGFLYVDLNRAYTSRGGGEAALTPTEYRLLSAFMENRDQVLTHQLLLEKLWDSQGSFVDKHALAVNINRLRGKIEDDGHKYIATVYGMGYQWIGENDGAGENDRKEDGKAR